MLITKIASRELGFEERARAFYDDIQRGVGFKRVNRGHGHYVISPLVVGVDDNNGLVFKREAHVGHARQAQGYYERLIDYFKRRGYEPFSYELFNPNFFPVGNHIGYIQEYFEEPTLHEILGYFHMKKRIEESKLTPKEIVRIKRINMPIEGSEERCEQFLKRQENNSMTFEQIFEVEREFCNDIEFLGFLKKLENIIILNQRGKKDLQRGDLIQRVGLAIIDY
ncbi:hypothetical protein J4405_02700 [Candidatus Woesearchaeota archaeon]|nr:hypothetical protein [Candidatus Woesearchaeota archaeon]